MLKSLPVSLALLTMIISCNNNDHKKQNGNAGFSREAILKDSIAKFPGLLLLKEELIQLYRDSADYDKALTAANDALLTDSLNARLWDIKATLQFENEDTLPAIQSFERALRLNPSPRYLILLGSLYAQTKNNRAFMIADALAKTKLPETEKEAFFITGLYHNYTGNKTAAIAALDKCLNLDNRHMFAYREKAIAFYDLGKYADALTELNKAVTLQNNFDEGYYWMGRCLEKLNKPKDAIEAYTMALLYAPDYVEAKEALARLGVK
jgi:tetratricopeptide (TPR) repeat protein